LQSTAENGGRWRALPKEFGKWYTIYRCFRYWIALGIFDLVEKGRPTQTIAIKRIKAFARDSTYVKVHPDAAEVPLFRWVGVPRT